MQNSPLTWNNGVPTSNIYGDIYFSRENGLEETIYVFLDGNNLPQRWRELDYDFHIIETGFGTGLNFFASLLLWNTCANKVKLHYTAIEKHPLTIDDIKRAISSYPQFDSYLEEFSTQYPATPNNLSKLVLSNETVQLTLLWGDVNEVISTITHKAHAWFLDGFSPSKNPDMWSDTLYKSMHKLTEKNGTFATFTASGNVRRGLQENGFSVRKIPGYGQKRHILAGNI